MTWGSLWVGFKGGGGERSGGVPRTKRDMRVTDLEANVVVAANTAARAVVVRMVVEERSEHGMGKANKGPGGPCICTVSV